MDCENKIRGMINIYNRFLYNIYFKILCILKYVCILIFMEFNKYGSFIDMCYVFCVICGNLIKIVDCGIYD